jgi:hypothetical protein
MSREAPRWWPPKVGSKLRHSTWHGAGGGRVKDLHVLLHVVSVFKDKDGERRIVTADWFPTKHRWNYEVFWWYQAAIGMIWPDGTRKPEEP